LLLWGVSLGPIGIVLAAVLVVAAVAWPLPNGRAVGLIAAGFAVLVIVKGLALAVAPQVGLLATYATGTARVQGSGAERSVEYRDLTGATRVDEALDLAGDRFPVAFFNDAARFNFGPDVQPARDQLPFTARWQGWVDVPTAGERRFVLDSLGPARVFVDDALLLETTAADVRQHSEAATQLTPGEHGLRVEYARPEARVPRLHLQWTPIPGGPLEVVGAPTFRPNAATGGQNWWPSTGPRPTQAIEIGFGLVLVTWLALAARNLRRSNLGRAALGLIPLLFLAYGMALHAPLIGRTTILSGLDDWLVYESSARDILLNGPLMAGGQQRAPAYYGQPLYPYVLALAHALTGEGLFGPLVLQFLALGTVVALSGVLARRAFGSRLAALWAVAAVLAFVVAQNEYVRVARQLFNENLYMPLVMASLVVLVGVVRRGAPPAPWRLVLVGVLLGVTAVSRSQFLAFVPFGLLILAVAWWRARRSAVATLLPLLAVVAGLALAIAPVTTRNWVVSGQFVPISASGGASLLEFHRPPPGLIDAAAVERDLLFEALHLDTQTRTVLAFARQDPLGYLATWLPLGAHSLGLPGRTGAGIYWPLLVVVLAYLAAFALPSARRLRVWPIHAFVASHLLILMLFEADTYGYRLVMPMYAPMLVVAAQVPLALVRLAQRAGSRAPERQGGRGWSIAAPAIALLVAIAAVGIQGRALLSAWPERDTNLVGLGGAAAHAAATAERADADVIYVASIDGTPRRYGAGSLPGLRYPWFKWFDPTRSLPLPPIGRSAVYALAELNGADVAGGLVGCLGPPDASAERTLDGAQARALCVASLGGSAPIAATFDGLARVDTIVVPERVEAGEAAETRLVWQPLARPGDAQQVWLHLEDPDDGTLWGNATLDLYPVRQWEPGEVLLSRLPLATEPTAIPDRYPLTLGLNAARGNAPSAAASWQGQRVDRVPVGSLTLLPSTRPGLANQELPQGMLPTAGVAASGLELVAARPPAPEAWPGKRVQVGLLWRAMQDAPQDARVRLRLVRDDGEVVQESVGPLFGGRFPASALRDGSVVRDEQTIEVGPRVAGDGLVLEVGLAGADAVAPIGKLSVAGRKHNFESTPSTPEAVFGSSMALLSHKLDPQPARPGNNVDIRLTWRADGSIEHGYKVFVHVLDRTGEKVLAQRDAEPLDGRAPTSGWVTGEVLDDEYEVAMPSDLAAGQYPVEVGVYEEKSGERLRLPSGDNRLILATRLEVR
jgi:hypothetical protein